MDGTLQVATFTGSIVNVGTIVAETGFTILDSTIQGALVDSGTIRATSAGIDVNSAAVIVGGIQVSSKGTITAHVITSGTGSASGIVVQNTTTFGGGITNSGTISADRFAILAFRCFDLCRRHQQPRRYLGRRGHSAISAIHLCRRLW